MQLYEIVKTRFNISDINLLNINNNDSVFKVASISKDLIYIAQKGNDLALSIVQEATTYVADYITFMYDSLKFDIISAYFFSI